MVKWYVPDVWEMELIDTSDPPEMLPLELENVRPPRPFSFRLRLNYMGSLVFEMKSRPEWNEPHIWFKAIEDRHPLHLLMEDANREASMGTKQYCHLNVLETPRDGKTLVSRWWVVRPGKGAVFHVATGGRLSVPQCNSNQQIAEEIQQKMYPGHDVVFVPVAYLGPSGNCDGLLEA